MRGWSCASSTHTYTTRRARPSHASLAYRERPLEPREELVVPRGHGRVEPQAPEGAAALDDEAGEEAELRRAALEDGEVARVEEEGVDALVWVGWGGVGSGGLGWCGPHRMRG